MTTVSKTTAFQTNMYLAAIKRQDHARSIIAQTAADGWLDNLSMRKPCFVQLVKYIRHAGRSQPLRHSNILPDQLHITLCML